MKVLLKSTEKALQFNVSNEFATMEVGANQNVEENQKTFRPMELLLTSLASCSAIDIQSILIKQRQEILDFEIETIGHRVDEVPAVFDTIHLNITVKGNIDASKLEKAIELTKEKYCSAYKMLSKSCEIIYEYKIIV